MKRNIVIFLIILILFILIALIAYGIYYLQTRAQVTGGASSYAKVDSGSDVSERSLRVLSNVYGLAAAIPAAGEDIPGVRPA